MICINNCGPLYERDGKMWCLNNYCQHSYFWDSFSPAQSEIKRWFYANGGHCGNPLKAIERLRKELKELEEAISFKKDKDAIREELADVGICLMMVANLVDVDLLTAMRWKHNINLQRKWKVDEHGCLSHVKGSDPRPMIAPVRINCDGDEHRDKEQIDYKTLLEKYMGFIAMEEGTTFINRIRESEVNFTEEEINVLKFLSPIGDA